MTECEQECLEFQDPGERRVEANFEGGCLSSDGGSLSPREIEDKHRFMRHLAGCFRDHRNPDLIGHSIEELSRQRGFGPAPGYEDLNDHDSARSATGGVVRRERSARAEPTRVPRPWPCARGQVDFEPHFRRNMPPRAQSRASRRDAGDGAVASLGADRGGHPQAFWGGKEDPGACGQRFCPQAVNARVIPVRVPGQNRYAFGWFDFRLRVESRVGFAGTFRSGADEAAPPRGDHPPFGFFPRFRASLRR